MKHTSIILLAAALLVGCASKPQQPEIRTVTEIKYVLLSPPVSFYKKIPMVPPPNKELYLNSTELERENLMARTYILQNAAVATCNKNFEKIDLWVKEQTELYKNK